MRLEYLPEGSDDCPLLRIYGFAPSDAQRLKSAFDALADGSLQTIDLHTIPGVETVDGCGLTLSAAARDRGVIAAPKPLRFECRLRASTWEQVAELTEPFCQDTPSGTYQWLDNTGNISLLLSTDGKW